jgi:signal transduction histidine kinase
VATGQLRFAPEILRRLGEELVPHPDLGVIELVRNAYDADAPTCQISLQHVEQPGGTVIVEDDGDGMTLDDLRSGWLLLGRSRKVHEATVSRKGRRRVGEKGLGRLAALRLGRDVTLNTRPRNEPGVEYSLVIDWDQFDRAEAVEDVQLAIEARETSMAPGTHIEIRRLRSEFLKPDVERLTRSLLLLTGPFPANTKHPFDVILHVPEFAKLEKIVHQTFFDEHEYKIEAELDDNGQASARLLNWRGEEIAAGEHHTIGAAGQAGKGKVPLQYSSPPAKFELWMYNLSTAGFDLRRSRHQVGDVRQWLQAVGGVHLFHRGLRVHPYGDHGHDWLEMNLRRARSPEMRPSTNTSIGRVQVIDEENLLTAKTDRSGFLEDLPFVELRTFCEDVLDWAAQQRLKLRERKRTENKTRSRERVTEAKDDAQKALRNLPQESREVAEQVTEKLADAYEERVRSLEDEVQLYRTLGTVGTTTAVFAHESSRPLARIEQAAGIIDRRLRVAYAEDYSNGLSQQLATVISSASSLRTFTDLPLGLVSRRKRRPKLVELNTVINGLLKSFQPHLEATGIAIEEDLTDFNPVVRTTEAAIEAIVANLLANATYAFTVPADEPRADRLILVRTQVANELAVISVLDNGPGINTEQIGLDDIWLPGNTTREAGTGLGLTIVRDVVTDLKGSCYAKAVGELNGAEFTIELPRTLTPE